MLTLSPRTRVFLALGATDMRKSFDTLAQLVRDQLSEDPLSGHLFVFANRLRNRIKVLFFDGSGLWVMAKRLEKGTFAWPKGAGREGRSVAMTTTELSMLVSGIEVSNTRLRRWYRRSEGAA